MTPIEQLMKEVEESRKYKKMATELFMRLQLVHDLMTDYSGFAEFPKTFISDIKQCLQNNKP